mgnify:CR=1 FL=1
MIITVVAIKSLIKAYTIRSCGLLSILFQIVSDIFIQTDQTDLFANVECKVNQMQKHTFGCIELKNYTV